MSTQEILDRMRESTSGCRVSALGDLESGLVLRASSVAPCPREQLDDLAASAQSVFEVARAMGPGTPAGSPHGTVAITFCADRSDVFVRPTTDSEEFAAARLEPASAMQAAVKGVQQYAQAFAGDSE